MLGVHIIHYSFHKSPVLNLVLTFFSPVYTILILAFRLHLCCLIIIILRSYQTSKSFYLCTICLPCCMSCPSHFPWFFSLSNSQAKIAKKWSKKLLKSGESAAVKFHSLYTTFSPTKTCRYFSSPPSVLHVLTSWLSSQSVCLRYLQLCVCDLFSP